MYEEDIKLEIPIGSTSSHYLRILISIGGIIFVVRKGDYNTNLYS